MARKDRKLSPEERARREAKKKERREERKRRDEEARRAKLRRRRLRDGAIAAVLIAGLGFLVFTLVRPDPEVEGVEKLPSEGRDHLASGATYDYGDPAPTSGPHDPRAPTCGAYEETLPLTLAVHALEHGAVILWHRPDIEESEVNALQDVMQSYDSHVIVAPNPAIADPVVATAWNRRMRFESAGDPVLAEFVDTYRHRAPEGSQECDI